MARKEHEVVFKISATTDRGFTSTFASAKTAVNKLKVATASVSSSLKNIEGYTQTEKALERNRDKSAALTKEHEKLSAAIKANADELNKLRAKEQELNDSKEKLKANLKDGQEKPAELEELEKSLKANDDAISKTEEQSSRLNSALKKKEEQLDKTNNKIGEQEEKLKSLKTELESTGISTDNLASETETLAKKYDELKKAQDKINDIDRAISKNKENINKTKEEIGKTVGTAAIMGGALYKGAIEPSMKFADQMSTVRAISNASEADMVTLTNKAKEMGRTTAFSATESGQAMEYMATAGWKTQEMLSGIGGIMNLAAGSGEDLASVSNIVTDGLTAFGMKANEVNRFVDVLATAANDSNTDVAMMGETFKYVAPVAGALKYTVEDVGLAIGLMANNGIKASQGGTALRAFMARLVKPTKQSAEAMEEIGLSIQNADGSVKPFIQTMEEMRAGMAGLNDADKSRITALLGGQEAMSGLLAIVNASDEDFYKLKESIDNSQGAAEKMADIKLDNLQGDLTIAKSAVEGLQIALGDALTPSLRNIVQEITPLIEKFAAWIEQNPETIEQIAGLITKLLALKTGMLGLKLGFQELKGGYLTCKKAIEIVNGLGGAISLLTSPLGIFVGGAALAAAGAYGISKAFEYAEDQTIKFSEEFVKAYDEYEKICQESDTTQKLIDEYRELHEAVKNYAEGSDEYVSAKERLKEIEQILIEQHPEFLNTYDAENDKIIENLGYIEQKIEKEKELSRIRLESEAEDAKDKLPGAIENQQNYSNNYDDYKQEYEKTVNARNELAILEQNYQTAKNQYEQGLITLDEYNTKKEGYVEKTKDISYDLGLVGPVDDAEDIAIKYEQAKNQTEAVIDDMESTNQKYVESTGYIQDYYDTQKKLIELNLGMTLQEAANKLNAMNTELQQLESSGQGSSEKANELRQSIAELQPKAEEATQELAELEASVKNVPDIITVDTSQAVANCSTLKTILDQIKSKQITVTSTYLYNHRNQTFGPAGDAKGPQPMPQIEGFAEGDIITKPIIASFAEEYPEAAIPLNPNSERSKNLWLKTGEYLGMNNYQNGNILESNYSGSSIEISITPNYYINNYGSDDLQEQLALHDRLLMEQIDERIEREKRLRYG